MQCRKTRVKESIDASQFSMNAEESFDAGASAVFKSYRAFPAAHAGLSVRRTISLLRYHQLRGAGAVGWDGTVYYYNTPHDPK